MSLAVRMFCNNNCRDGLNTDLRYGVIGTPYGLYGWGPLIRTRRCGYCFAFVPTNAQQRAAGKFRNPQTGAWQTAAEYEAYLVRQRELRSAA